MLRTIEVSLSVSSRGSQELGSVIHELLDQNYAALDWTASSTASCA